MEDRDPVGCVSIYPAEDGGITQTFPHQLHNESSEGSRPWRRGKICTTTPENVLGRLSQSEEPLGLEDRLIWHVQRALLWIKLASQGKLAEDGAPYELPHFPSRDAPRFVFSEDKTSLQLFQGKGHRSGLARLRRLELPAGDIFVIDQFQGNRGEDLNTVAWGTALANAKTMPGDIARWILLDSVTLSGPWQVPVTFNELRHAMKDQGLSFDDLLLPLPHGLRDGLPHLLLIGFPIPEAMGDDSVELHWQALLLPALARDVIRGFRRNELGWKATDGRTLASSSSIRWIRSENWGPANSHARGRFATEITQRRVLVIGAGALGSAVAELLVRGGLKHLTVCDGDLVEQGNLARHTLGIWDVGTGKAVALATRLQSISAHVEVAAIQSLFPDFTEEQMDTVSNCDLIVDCTAEESTLYAIEEYAWAETAYAVSMSFGWHVRRLYVVGSPCAEFTRDGIIDLLHPFVQQDLASRSTQEVAREGPGCWHPVFPGRADDVWMMAAIATKELERLVTHPAGGIRGTMVKWLQEDSFEGVSRQVIS